jgi:glycosyltransferase involved in cell wall biosynthesis
MHIGVITPEFPPDIHGGVGTLMREMAAAIIQAGHRATVVHVTRGKHGSSMREDSWCGADVVRLTLTPPKWLRWRLGELWACRELNRTIRRVHKRSPLTALFANDGSAFFPFGVAANIPLVTGLGGTEFLFHQEMNLPRESKFVFDLQRRSMEKSRLLVANSNYTARAMPACYGLRNSNIRTVYHSVDTSLFCPSDSITPEEGLIVFSNSIEQRKGIFELFEAIKTVCAEFPHARLHVAGKDVRKGASGEALSAELWKSLPPSARDRVTFLGPLDRETALLDLLRRAHLCCYPSHIETFGYAPVEAMAVGKPVIYSRTGPGPELIEDGTSGLLCDPRSPANIADCIRKILLSPNLAHKLGSNARISAERMFDRRKWGETMVGLFEEVSSPGKNH